jgi:hypothetical protein
MKLEKEEEEEENLTFTPKYTVLSFGCHSSIDDDGRLRKNMAECRELRSNSVFPILTHRKKTKKKHTDLSLCLFSLAMSHAHTPGYLLVA